MKDVIIYGDIRDEIFNKRLRDGISLFDYIKGILGKRGSFNNDITLVEQVAQKFADNKQCVPYQEILDAGTVGLLKARHTFMHNYNIKFTTYVARCIDNEIIDYLHNK